MLDIPFLTVLIPAHNEASSIGCLYDEIRSAFSGYAAKMEIIWVDDGSTDATWRAITVLCEHDGRARGIKLRRRVGKACALRFGFAEARGEIILTLDADLQDDPLEALKVLNAMKEDCDMVVGWRCSRMDALEKRAASRLYNLALRLAGGTHLHDHNCGMKALRRHLALTLPLYGDFHRYMCLFAVGNGYRVGEVKIQHRPRRFGLSKYNRVRCVTSALDFITIMFILRYGKRPLRLLGFCGVSVAALGLTIMTYAALLWCGGTHIGNRPLLIYGLAAITFGTQLVSIGMIGDLIVWTSERGNDNQSAGLIARRTHDLQQTSDDREMVGLI